MENTLTMKNEQAVKFPALGYGLGQSLRPPRISVDVSETDTEILIVADVPGVEKDDLSIEIVGNTLTFSGIMTRENGEGPRRTFFRFERASGPFSRHIVLPTLVDEDDVDASVHNGVLFIHLKKKARIDLSKKIPIREA